ncbi:MAG: OsmC family protein [Rubrivivax sp.]|nr:OsmC family protein [Rubrivivax sp.]
MPTRNLRFTSASGIELAARLDLPGNEPRAYAVFAHCFTCSKDSKAATFVSQALAARGIATLRFDFTGLGQSGGDFADSSFSANVADLIAAVRHLGAQFAPPQVLIGHSLGGAAVLAAAGQLPEVRAVATIGAPCDPAHVKHLFAAGHEAIGAQGEAVVDIGGRPFRIKRAFVDDLERHDAGASIGALRKALLVMHAPSDRTVSVDNAAEIFMRAKHPKSFVSLDDADHLLSRKQDAAYAAEVIAAWASRYLDPAAQGVAAAAPSAEEDPGVRATLSREASAGRFATDITAGRHGLRADEPTRLGGADTGPGPYELLLAALGACTAMTLRMYADQKKWPLEQVRVDLKHDKIHATDCAECETRDGRVDRIERVLHLEGALDAAQRARLVEMADKCPVHRTLHSEVLIRTREAQ